MTSESEKAMREVREGAQRVQAGAKGANLFADRVAQAFGDDAEGSFEKRCHDFTGQSHSNQKQRARHGGAQRSVADLLHDFRVGQAFGPPNHAPNRMVAEKISAIEPASKRRSTM